MFPFVFKDVPTMQIYRKHLENERKTRKKKVTYFHKQVTKPEQNL